MPNDFYADREGLTTIGELVVEKDIIVVPRTTKPYPLVILLAPLGKVEARMQEAAYLTKEKADELSSTLNIAWRDLNELIVLLQFELDTFKSNYQKEWDRVLLDEVLPQIKEKKLQSAKDIRDAMIRKDPAVQAADARVHELTCVVTLLKGKQKAIEMAFTQTKKHIDEGRFRGYNIPDHGDFGAGNKEAPVGGGERPGALSRVRERVAEGEGNEGFGTPRY